MTRRSPLPTEQSARVARNTQLILQHEAQLTRVADPLGGSYYVEALTHSLGVAAHGLISRIESMGGMMEAVAGGLPKLEIEAAAARRQAAIDRGEDVIVGVNKFTRDREPEIEVRAIDNSKVRAAQIAKLQKLKTTRNAAKVTVALEALKNGARTDANLLALAVEAMRVRATLGEVSLVLEDVFGRHKAKIKSVSGVYGASHGDLRDIENDIASFARRPDTGPGCWSPKLARMVMTAAQG